MNRAIQGVLLTLTSVTLTACLPQQTNEATLGAVHALTPTEQLGQRVFMANCQQCHPGGNAGLGPSLNDKLLPGFAIKLQVRNGFGAMPAFSSQEISDEQLDALVPYLVRLRHQGPRGQPD